jgi:hypothetical protein
MSTENVRQMVWKAMAIYVAVIVKVLAMVKSSACNVLFTAYF